MKKNNNPVLIILAFFFIYVIWGLTYLLNKIAVSELQPFMLASIRFMSAGILIFILSKIFGYKLIISMTELKNTAIAGFLFLTFGNGVVVWALKYVDSGFAALVISAQPIVVLLLMKVLDGKKIQPMSIVGVFLGMLGIYLLVAQKEIVSHNGNMIGTFMIIMCMFSWGFGSLFVSKAQLPSNFFVNTGYQMITGGFMLFITSILLGEKWTFPTVWSNQVQVSMLLLIVFGSIVAFTSFNYLLRTVSPEKVATSTYVNPIIALFFGWYYLNEQITNQSLIAAFILLTGVYFINTKKRLIIFSRFSK